MLPSDTLISPVTPSQSGRRRSVTNIDALLSAPVHRKAPSGSFPTAWALKLKDCVDATAKELHVEVLSARPIRFFDPTELPDDPRDMLFELETNHGMLEVIRDRAGHHAFRWL